MEDKPTTENKVATNNIATCKPNPKDGWNPGKKHAKDAAITANQSKFDQLKSNLNKRKSNLNSASPELNQDEAIMAQERQIEKEIADNIPLISDKIGLDVLLNEYQFTDDESYQKKIYVGAFVYSSVRLKIVGHLTDHSHYSS